MQVPVVTPQSKGENHLLRALPRDCAERLTAASVYVDLPLATPLFQRDEKPHFLYLLTSGIASVIFTSERGKSVELSTQGNEGLIGCSYLLGPMSEACDCNMQVAGAAYRVPLAVMQRELDDSPDTRQRILEYAQQQSIISSQIAACNRLHRAEARFVRWLLMVSDRLGSNELPMTQEFLSMMLGARRTTVAEVCAELNRARAVEGRRGGLRITNRSVLESRVCECYSILRARSESLYSQPLRVVDGH